MKCLYCQKDLTNPKAKFCSPVHKMKFRRENKTVTINEITVTDVTINRNKETVTNNRNISKIPEWDSQIYYTGEITEEVLKNLGEIYKKFEKENKGFKCLPYMERGKQKLTAWERMKLKQMDLPNNQ